MATNVQNTAKYKTPPHGTFCYWIHHKRNRILSYCKYGEILIVKYMYIIMSKIYREVPILEEEYITFRRRYVSALSLLRSCYYVDAQDLPAPTSWFSGINSSGGTSHRHYTVWHLFCSLSPSWKRNSNITSRRNIPNYSISWGKTTVEDLCLE